MTLLAILSLFQITLLPGALLLCAANYRGPMSRRIVLAFGLSLTTNYLVVFVLTAVGLYTRPVMLAIFGGELIALSWTNRAHMRRWLFSPLLPAIFNPIAADIRSRRQGPDPGLANNVRRTAMAVLLVLALVQIGRILVEFAGNWGTTFSWVDAVFSWNRWAVTWAENTLPPHTYHYPQLVPINWSISYVFMNMPLQYVGRGMMPLFMLAMLVAMVHVGWTGRAAGFLVAAIITPYLYEGCRILITEGGADLPVACMAFLSFFCVAAARWDSAAKYRTFYLAVGAVLGAGAAVTKQNGLYFLALYPVFAYGLVLRKQSGSAQPGRLRLVGIYVAVILIVVLPYYIYSERQIQAGHNKSEVAYVMQGIHQGASVPQRVVNASQAFLDHMGQIPTFLIASLCLISLGERLSRWVVGLIVVPWWLLWAAFFSYDLRNLSLALPFLALSVGTGAVSVGRILTGAPIPVWRFGSRRLSEVHTWVLVAAATALLTAGIAFGLEPTPERLVAHHRRLERALGNAALNAQIYAQTPTPFTGTIVTDYVWLLKLPDLGQRCVLQDFIGEPPTIMSAYQRNVADPRVSHLLFPTNADDAVLRHIAAGLQRGDFKQLFGAEGYLFVEIVRR